MNWRCKFGFHGPSDSDMPTYPYNCSIGPFLRGCRVCGMTWSGAEIEVMARREPFGRFEPVRSVGDWREEGRRPSIITPKPD